MSYAKLFSSITESSLWSEPKEVRLLFVSMLARADLNGFVEASIPGLARLANLTMEETEDSIRVLESPDIHSKDLDENPENEGRRLQKVPGGWTIINYDIYRERRNEDDRREYMREYMQQYRKRKRKQNVNSVSRGKPQLAQAEAEAEAEAVNNHASESGSTSGGASPARSLAFEWVEKLTGEPRFAHVKNIRAELRKAERWYRDNGKGKALTRARAVRWLERIDPPLTVPDAKEAAKIPPDFVAWWERQDESKHVHAVTACATPHFVKKYKSEKTK